MSFLSAIKSDLSQFPIWDWVENVGADEQSPTSYTNENKDYTLMFHPKLRRAWILDLEEFLRLSDGEMLYTFIVNQKVEHEKKKREEDLWDQKGRALELFPNVDLTRHTGDDTFQKKFPVGSTERAIAEELDGLTLEDWGILAKEKGWKASASEFRARSQEALIDQYNKRIREDKQASVRSGWDEYENWSSRDDSDFDLAVEKRKAELKKLRDSK